MTTLFPHAAYAEDQTSAQTILTFHVLRAGATAGAFVSVPIGLGARIFSKTVPRPSVARALLISSARGTATGFVFAGLALAGRMWGKDAVEWQDRSWRLLANRGQVEADNWILGGGAGGMVAAVVGARRGRLPVGMADRVGAAVLGSAGLGMAGGMLGQVAYRNGLRGGKWEETAEEIKQGAEAAAKGVVEGVKKS